MGIQDKIDKVLIQIKNGEKAICPLCKKGEFHPAGDSFAASSTFVCDNCGEQIILN